MPCTQPKNPERGRDRLNRLRWYSRRSPPCLGRRKQPNLGQGWSCVHPAPGAARPCSDTAPLPAGERLGADLEERLVVRFKDGGKRTIPPDLPAAPASPGHEVCAGTPSSALKKWLPGTPRSLPSLSPLPYVPSHPQKSHLYPAGPSARSSHHHVCSDTSHNRAFPRVTQPQPGKAPTRWGLKQKLVGFFPPTKAIYSKEMPTESD